MAKKEKTMMGCIEESANLLIRIDELKAMGKLRPAQDLLVKNEGVLKKARLGIGQMKVEELQHRQVDRLSSIIERKLSEMRPYGKKSITEMLKMDEVPIANLLAWKDFTKKDVQVLLYMKRHNITSAQARPYRED
ncbi:MAG: hypothetical protein ABIH34_05130 [Nanoarchaeota archaeon]